MFVAASVHLVLFREFIPDSGGFFISSNLATNVFFGGGVIPEMTSLVYASVFTRATLC